MKLNKLLPLLSIPCVATVITPIAVACNAGGNNDSKPVSFTIEEGVEFEPIVPQSENPPTNPGAIEEPYFNDVNNNPMILAQDLAWGFYKESSESKPNNLKVVATVNKINNILERRFSLDVVVSGEGEDGIESKSTWSFVNVDFELAFSQVGADELPQFHCAGKCFVPSDTDIWSASCVAESQGQKIVFAAINNESTEQEIKASRKVFGDGFKCDSYYYEKAKGWDLFWDYSEKGAYESKVDPAEGGTSITDTVATNLYYEQLEKDQMTFANDSALFLNSLTTLPLSSGELCVKTVNFSKDKKLISYIFSAYILATIPSVGDVKLVGEVEVNQIPVNVKWETRQSKDVLILHTPLLDATSISDLLAILADIDGWKIKADFVSCYLEDVEHTVKIDFDAAHLPTADDFADIQRTFSETLEFTTDYMKNYTKAS